MTETLKFFVCDSCKEINLMSRRIRRKGKQFADRYFCHYCLEKMTMKTPVHIFSSHQRVARILGRASRGKLLSPHQIEEILFWFAKRNKSGNVHSTVRSLWHDDYYAGLGNGKPLIERLGSTEKQFSELRQFWAQLDSSENKKVALTNDKHGRNFARRDFAVLLFILGDTNAIRHC